MTAAPAVRREKVDMAVFAAVPGFVRLTLRLRAADRDCAPAAARALLRRASDRSRDAGDLASDLAADPEWREAYAQVGLPHDTVPPHEALAGWAARQDGVPSQGPLLDVLHAFALENRVPVAAYDLAEASGDLWLRPSRGYELHEPVSGDSVGTPPMGELILVDSADSVMARSWHGSAGRPTAVRGVPTEALVHVDLLSPSAPEIDGLEDALRRLVAGFAGGRAETQRLSWSEPVVRWTE